MDQCGQLQFLEGAGDGEEQYTSVAMAFRKTSRTSSHCIMAREASLKLSDSTVTLALAVQKRGLRPFLFLSSISNAHDGASIFTEQSISPEN